MNWKFWTWPGQIRVLKSRLEDSRKLRNALVDDAMEDSLIKLQLTLARRSLARTKEAGLTDDQMAEAFTHLLENKGFEAILQLLTSEELNAADSMTEAKATFHEMKHHAGAVSALSNFHKMLIDLETQAKGMAKNKAA